MSPLLPPQGVRLPPCDIQLPASPWRRLALPLGLPVLATAGVVLGLNHSSSGVIGALVAVVVLAVIIGIEVPWLLRRQRRRQAGYLNRLPHGVFYAGLARTPMPGNRGPVQGSLLLDSQGMTFTPLRGGAAPMRIPWSAVLGLRLKLAPGQPMAAAFEIATDDGTLRTFIVRGYPELARALQSNH